VPAVQVADPQEREASEAAGDPEPTRLSRWAPRIIRVARVATPIVVAMGIIGAVLSWRWFVDPVVDDPLPVDAIAVFGGSGPRLERGRQLIADGFAENFVIVQNNSNSVGNYIPECFPGGDELAGANVFCFDPMPGTTRGEAQELARLATANGWDSMLVIVSTDQVHRAREIVDRCTDADVYVTAVPSWERRVVRIAYEWGALFKSTFVHPGC
jgi:hypothetical protein